MNTGTARAFPGTSSAAPDTAAEPRPGDVIVGRDTDPEVRFSVRLHPGPVQFTTNAREDALRIAREFAEHQRVDLWQSEAGTCRRLERNRRPTSEAVDS